jgi:hypothetical protein
MKLRPYVVRQGDYLDKLAHLYGFRADEVWQHDANRALRERRPSPSLLAPGDVLHVPIDPSERGVEVYPKQANRYRARTPLVEVTVVLRDEAGEPSCVGEAFAAFVRGERVEGVVAEGGRVRLSVPVTESEVTVVLERLGVVMPVRVGHLDPLDEASGVRHRLDHLGYDTSDLDEATRAFQRAHELEPTGVVDEATRRALRRGHLV